MKTTIKFPKSDSFAFFVTINKIAKALDNAFFTVKENPDEEPVLQKKLGAGISLADSRLYKNQLSYKVQIDGADTQFMEVGVRYFFDVKGTIGNAQKTFLWGELILSDTETGYLNPAMQGDTVAVAQVYTATFETGAQSQYVETESDPVATAKIGDMTKLNTTAKDTLVKAINEVNAPTFTESAPLENVVSGEKQSTLWGKVKKWLSSLKALAFKDKVGTGDITDGAVTTAKFSSDAKCPKATNADNATNSTNSTNSTNATNAKKVNNIEFVSDSGVIKRKSSIKVPVTMGNELRSASGTSMYELTVQGTLVVGQKLVYNNETAEITEDDSENGYYTLACVTGGQFAQQAGKTIVVDVDFSTTIPQRELLWGGSKSIGTTIPEMAQISGDFNGSVLEIYYAAKHSSTNDCTRYYAKFTTYSSVSKQTIISFAFYAKGTTSDVHKVAIYLNADGSLSFMAQDAGVWIEKIYKISE